MELKIYQEFEELIPPLTEEEFKDSTVQDRALIHSFFVGGNLVVLHRF